MPHSAVENYMHIIFATKNRESSISTTLDLNLHSYLAGIAKQRQVPFLKINGTEDHLHILLKLHPNVALSTLLREMKSYSTAWIKKQGFPHFAWQEGYGGFSCSHSHLELLKRYIELQKEHHKKTTFAEEVTLLNRQWGTRWMKD